ncbi:hypothetical protein OJ253_2534 [Cryptosporidium canis]|uniref:CBF1-interacting co-repressor CIR N-terminal domain-containing protein n=1 Tax=Cryptosporidium canis TaxID=195482 RepID=A0A9D5HWX3_9CRYT|nr:hypothetical protein OJ253_2534 [Cryptosporidium canis]
MNVQRISNKASVFLNHKHFHPGNSKNREKVWLAEEKLREEERKQEELLKKRKKEWEIEELRRDLIQSQKRTRNQVEVHSEMERVVSGREKLHDVFSDKAEGERSWVKSGNYEEDVLIGDHSSVWGSFYDKDTKKWGFRCCKTTVKGPVCSAFRKSKSRVSKAPDPNLSMAPHSADRLQLEDSEPKMGKTGSLLLNGGKPFSKQCKGVSEFLNILRKSSSSS